MIAYDARTLAAVCDIQIARRMMRTPQQQKEVGISQTRTGHSHPLEIAEVATGPGRGLIGVTYAPGKKRAQAWSGDWRRDLEADLDVVAAWNAVAVVTLVEPQELTSLQIESIGDLVRRRHMEWHHLPIRDVSVPSAKFEAAWTADSRKLRSLLEMGANVLVHCNGGLGRSGMVTARILVEMGADPDEAIANVRNARPGAIETIRRAGSGVAISRSLSVLSSISPRSWTER